MQTKPQNKEGRKPSTPTAIQSFDRYKDETEKGQAGIQVIDDIVMQRLTSAWKSFDVSDFSDYDDASRLLKGMDCSPEDVQRFCVASKQFEDEEYFSDKLGVFLSALINTSSHDDFELSLGHLDSRLDSLCEYNSKNVKVIGNVGDSFGLSMIGGSLTLVGNAGEGVGRYMEGGRISVSGDVEQDLARCMEGGEIVIKGDAGIPGDAKLLEVFGIVHKTGIAQSMKDGLVVIKGNVFSQVGQGMKGGEIHVLGDMTVFGDMDVIGEVEAGRICHKGMVIVDKVKIWN
jgi:formylmethanofuran dehydrogenase subunit C